MSSQDLIVLAKDLNAVVKKRILIVEDNQINAIVLRRILQNCNFDTFVVEDGKKGVDAVVSFQPDLVLMDINMPVMNGIDSTKEIRNLPGNISRVPIFAVTADITTETTKISKSIGMNEYLTKPIDVDVLLKLILEYL